MHASVSIRQLGLEDYDRWMSLWERAGLHSARPLGRDSREAFGAQFAAHTHIMLGLERDLELIAVVLVTHDGRKGWINRLAVLPEHRRQRYAARLLQEAERVLKAQGIHVIAALIEPDNEASLAFFRQAGYAETAGMHYVSKRDRSEA